MQTALITGASDGLGAEFAKIFAREGYGLVLTARRADKLDAVARELKESFGTAVTTLPLDLSEKDAARGLYEEISRRGIEVSVLVNNAGFGDLGAYADADWEKQYRMIQLNITALIQLTHCFLRPMLRKRRGKILNLASAAAFQAMPYWSVYAASKAFVLSFTEALAEECRGAGVSVTALCPGPVATGFEAALGRESGLFNRLKPADARAVAEYGYRAMMRGRTVLVPGMKNKAVLAAARLAPRWLTRRAIKTMQEKAEKARP